MGKTTSAERMRAHRANQNRVAKLFAQKHLEGIQEASELLIQAIVSHEEGSDEGVAVAHGMMAETLRGLSDEWKEKNGL